VSVPRRPRERVDELDAVDRPDVVCGLHYQLDRGEFESGDRRCELRFGVAVDCDCECGRVDEDPVVVRDWFVELLVTLLQAAA
jgi:hypothetical protein